MSWSRRVRPALFVVGAALLVGSLLGARALTKSNGQSNGEQPKTANPASTTKLSGPIVLGTVDSDPSPVPYLLPPVLQSGTVVKVFVKAGQDVKADEPLYKFDTSIQEGYLDKARKSVAVAKTKVDSAVEKAKEHANEITVTKLAVTSATQEKDLQANHYNLVESALKTSYKTQNYDPDTWPKRLRDDPNLYKANVDYVTADNKLSLSKAKLAALEAANPQVLVEEARAGVKLAEAEESNAQNNIDLCTVKAKSAGTIERITIGEGSTLGIGTREPALWLIPAGSRIVRAEVEADFAHRVGKDLEGKQVVVFDNTDPRLTYRGKVLHVPGTFLPKRFGGESLIGNDTRVLEAIIEILDPAQPGQPPLRVGQRVRVGLGQ